MRPRALLGGLFGLISVSAAREAHATIYEIGPADDLEASIGMLVAGDELVLQGGTYTLNGYFEIAASGADGMPIVIRAKDGETPVITQQAAQNVINVLGSYLTLRGLELTGGSRGIRIQTGSYVTIEDCHIHDTPANAISANDTGVDYAGIIIRRNQIRNTGGNGEGMYLGCNDNACQFHDGIIEGNWVHHTNGPTVDQGDGIEIKEGSYGNIVRDNVVHDTGYPCIITYSTVGNGPPNIIERNVMWACGDHAIQSAADVVIRNNIILGAAADGIRNQMHQAGSPDNIVIVHNTILKANGTAIRSQDVVGSVLIANNALYAQTGDAISVAGNLAGVTALGNVGMGSLQGVSSGFAATGSLGDFVAANFSGAPPNDPFPAPGSMLIAAGDAAHVTADDFNGTDRAGIADAGAYKFDAAGNPGWPLGPGFKDAPAGQGGGGEGGSGPGSSSASSGSGGPSGSGSGAGTGAGSGGGAADGDDGDGCGCVTAGSSTSRSAAGLALLVAAAAFARRRRLKSSR